MNQDQNQNPDHDPVLADAGARLRDGVEPLSPAEVEAAVLKLSVPSPGGGVAGLVEWRWPCWPPPSSPNRVATTTAAALAATGRGVAGRASAAQAEEVLAGLGDAPVDPTKVRLVSTVTTFADCDALVADLRRVGAQHVGSRGFRGRSRRVAHVQLQPRRYGHRRSGRQRLSTPMARQDSKLAYTGPGDESTLGTNVQVAGVDELDSVKAVGDLIYDLDGRGTCASPTGAAEVRSCSTSPPAPMPPTRRPVRARPPATVSQILVGDGTVAVFGEEYEGVRTDPR